ncbi:hypothetical protein R3I93_008744 [Phoxinus phoxinus]|uniref:Uncharacterized protein n=2 Tax=Phoxinus phoxinus TaxID=58324 RepID=A0AAN9H7U5_9TELE
MMDKIIFTSVEPNLHSRVLKPQRTRWVENMEKLVRDHSNSIKEVLRMRGMSAMIVLALCALLIITYQAVKQELNIRNLQTRIVVSGEQVRFKEDGIMSAKTKVDEITKKLSALTTQRDQLKKQRDDFKKGTDASDKELGTCKTEKGTLEKKSNEAKEALNKLKGDQDAEKKKAEEEIQGLKRSILERDVNICKFVDITMEESKKLCAIAL